MNHSSSNASDKSRRKFPDETTARQSLCEAAHRLFERGLVVGNEGNLSAQIAADRFLCTPTSRCKGRVRPEELCLVDGSGTRIEGPLLPTSEIQLHLEIYRQRADVAYVVHAHPPHVLVFAVAREPIPQGILPEIDFFLGEVPLAPYYTPGGVEFAQTILPFVKQVPLIVLANHGTVSYGPDADLALANTEMLDRYCYILLQTISLGRAHYLSGEAVRDLLRLKQRKGMPDTRDVESSDEALFDLRAFRSTWEAIGLVPRVFQRQVAETIPSTVSGKGPRAELDEVWMERLAERIAEKLR